MQGRRRHGSIGSLFHQDTGRRGSSCCAGGPEGVRRHCVDRVAKIRIEWSGTNRSARSPIMPPVVKGTAAPLGPQPQALDNLRLSAVRALLGGLGVRWSRCWVGCLGESVGARRRCVGVRGGARGRVLGRRSARDYTRAEPGGAPACSRGRSLAERARSSPRMSSGGSAWSERDPRRGCPPAGVVGARARSSPRMPSRWSGRSGRDPRRG